MTSPEIIPSDTPILDETYLAGTLKGVIPQEEISPEDAPFGVTREMVSPSEVSGIFAHETGLTPAEFVEKKEPKEVEATLMPFLSKLSNEALHDFETEIVANIRSIGRQNKKKLGCAYTLYILLTKEIIKRRDAGTLPNAIDNINNNESLKNDP